MIKKIKVKQIKIGMFIHDMNCSWLNHPFMGRGRSINVTNKHIIEKIHKSVIEEVYIDTEKGLDVSGSIIKEEVDKNILKELMEIAKKDRPEDVRQVSMGEEMFVAKRIKSETMKAVQTVIHDVKLGRQIEKGRIDNQVEEIIFSIFRKNRCEGCCNIDIFFVFVLTCNFKII